ncbi:MAG: histidine kinase, partial [Sphaerochaeta sp.]
MNASKRQAQFLALQNQINPHFLYNTLEGIRAEALL